MRRITYALHLLVFVAHETTCHGFMALQIIRKTGLRFQIARYEAYLFGCPSASDRPTENGDIADT
ncbi:hypothetical protein DI396_05530 [Litorivita pollutaquae]|uniref:Uncharacterized protein n=1 Tax=Litorivita pollutaquae TaxID=2200892 RepID=A0A2V4MVU7_9RHOB|nr:hypothetical protein DI396_05530 [Litorivita pollutaquae]